MIAREAVPPTQCDTEKTFETPGLRMRAGFAAMLAVLFTPLVFGQTGTIGATPNPCSVTTLGGRCTINLSWTSSGVSSAQVWVTDANGAQVRVATGISGSQSLNWIEALPQSYTFQLYRYSGTTRGPLLSSVNVAVPSPRLSLDVQPAAPQTFNLGQTMSYTMTVRDPANNPVSGVSVTIQDGVQGGFSQTVTTNGSGQATYGYSIPTLVTPGNYSITFGPAARAGYTQSSSVTRQVTVNGGSLTLEVTPSGVHATAPNQSVSYSIVVRDPSNNAVSGAAVPVSNPLIGNTTLTTGPAGSVSYSFTVPAGASSGNTTLTFGAASKAGFLSSPSVQRTLTVNGPQPALTLDVQPAAQQSIVQGGSVTYTATVLDAASAAVVGAAVVVTNPFTGTNSTITTAADGRAAFALAVPANQGAATYTVFFSGASKSGYTSSSGLQRLLTVQAAAAPAATLTLTAAGQSVSNGGTLTLTVPPGGNVPVAFSSAGSTAGSGSISSYEWRSNGTSIGNGQPSFSMAFGTQSNDISLKVTNSLGASATATAKILISITSTPALSLDVTPAGAQTLNQGAPLAFALSVKDPGGAPVSGVSIPIADGLQGGALQTVTTDAAGQATYGYSIPTLVAPGAYTMAFGPAAKTGFTPSGNATRQVTVNGTALVLDVQPGGTQSANPGQPVSFSLTVKDSSGSPVGGATVPVANPLAANTSVTTSSAGTATYSFTVAANAGSGTSNVTFGGASKSGFLTSALVQRAVAVLGARPFLVLDVQPGGTQQLLPGQNVNYTLTVRDGVGSGVSGAVISAVDPFTGTSRTVTSSAGGAAVFALSVPSGQGFGNYWLYFSAAMAGYVDSNSVPRQIVVMPGASAAAPALQSVPPSGTQGTSFVISGTGFSPNGAVARFVQSPAGGVVQELGTISADSSGQISWPWASSCADATGAWISWMRDITTNRQSNQVTQVLNAAASCGNQPLIQSTPPSGPQGSTFTITGTGFSPNGEVRRRITAPGQGQQEVSAIRADASGNINWPYASGCADAVGTWTLSAIDAARNLASNSVTQIITALPTCGTPVNLLDHADLVAETYPDGTSVPAGTSYTKQWTLRNTGGTTWNSSYQLEFVSGDVGCSRKPVSVPQSIGPSQSYSFSVACTAPEKAGPSKQTWHLKGPSGTVPVGRDSQVIWALINVPAAPVKLLVDKERLDFRYQANVAGADRPDSVTVRSSGADIPISIEPTTKDGGAWLSVSASGQSTPATLSVSVLRTLLNGSYQGSIKINSSAAPTVTIPVNLTITSYTPPPQEDPSSNYVLIGNVDAGKDTIVLTHGLSDQGQTSFWTGSGELEAITFLRGALGPKANEINILQYIWKDALQVDGLPWPSTYRRARSHAYDAGIQLSNKLFYYLGGVSYSKRIHFIGHSLGTVVNTYAASDFLKRATNVRRAQFTALDRPHHVGKMVLCPDSAIVGAILSTACALEKSKFETLYGFDGNFFAANLFAYRSPPDLVLKVDNYYTTLLGLGVGDVANGEVYNHFLKDPGELQPLFKDGVKNDHSGVQQWYRWTMNPRDPLPDGSTVCTGPAFTWNPSGFNDTLNPCERGWAWSILANPMRVFPPNNGGPKGTTKSKVLPYVAPQATDPNVAKCAPTLLSGYVSFSCVKASSPYSAISVDIPPNATAISFNYKFANSGTEDYAVVALDNIPIWTLSGTSARAGVEVNTGHLPINGLTGPRILTVALFGVGEGSFSFDIKDFEVHVPDVAAASVLSVSKTHTGNFAQAQQNAQFSITVSNAASAGPTAGTVTVTENLPPSLALVSMSGSGWNCAANMCTRTDSLAPGSAYPPIAVAVNVSSSSASPQVNSVAVSGGASPGASATDSVVVTTLPPQAPSIVSGTPNNPTGSPQTFTFTARDPNGFANLRRVYFLINTSADIPANTCHGFYDRPANALYLYNDALTALVGPITPGVAGSIQNGQCVIDGPTSALYAASGTDLAVRIGLGLKATYVSSAKKIYILAQDDERNDTGWVQTGTWNPLIAASAPTIAGGTPTNPTGSPQSFTLSARDLDGFANIQRIYFLVNSNTGIPPNSCHGFYDRQSNGLFLYNDNLSILLGPVTPGTPGTLENGQCAVDGATSALYAASGTDLSVKIGLSLKGSFAAVSRKIYLLAQDIERNDSGWVQTGTWGPVTALPQPPTVVSATPANPSGSPQTFTIALRDPNGFTDIHRVYFLINITPTIPQNVCHGFYDRQSNTLSLYNDPLTLLMGPVTPGSQGAMQNGQCAIDGPSSALVSTSGTDMTIRLGVGLVGNFAVGPKNLYVLVQDAQRNDSGWVQAAAWGSPSASQPPVIVSGSPSNVAGSPQTFTFTARDPNGFANIRRIYFLVNGATSIPQNSCHGFYDRPTNAFYLYNDALSALTGPLTPGASGVIQNGQCAIDGPASALFATSGTDLTIRAGISLKGSFAGTAQKVYLLAQDVENNDSGWNQVSNWGIVLGTKIPSIVSGTPNNPVTSPQVFSFTARDADGFANLQRIYFLVSDVASVSRNACHGFYDRPANAIFLYDDSLSSLSGPITPGVAGAIQNTQCRIEGTSSALFAASGTDLTIRLAMSLRGSYVGSAKRIYLLAQDFERNDTGWVQIGTWSDRGWMSFSEGDPGVPGDGVFATCAPTPTLGFEATSPFPLASFADGATATVFLPPGTQNMGNVAFGIVNKSAGACRAQFGASAGLPTGTVTVNGVQGQVTNIPQSAVDAWLAFGNQTRSGGCPALTVSDLYIGYVQVFSNTPPLNIRTIDAFAIRPGQNQTP